MTVLPTEVIREHILPFDPVPFLRATRWVSGPVRDDAFVAWGLGPYADGLLDRMLVTETPAPVHRRGLEFFARRFVLWRHARGRGPPRNPVERDWIREWCLEVAMLIPWYWHRDMRLLLEIRNAARSQDAP